MLLASLSSPLHLEALDNPEIFEPASDERGEPLLALPVPSAERSSLGLRCENGRDRVLPLRADALRRVAGPAIDAARRVTERTEVAQRLQVALHPEREVSKKVRI